ncbi:MAG: hypothetical protein QXX20_07525 [Candidatus Thermoplasmatota archaeon]
MKDDPIARVLDDLLKFDDILACMVGRRGMIDSVLPSRGTNGFKPEVYELWDIVKRVLDAQLDIISQFPGHGKLSHSVMDYEVLFYVIPDTDSALVAIVPALANKGLIDVEMERAKQKIKKIMDEQEKKYS